MTTRIVVAAAMCTPTRTHVKNALQPYGVKFRIAGEYTAGAYLMVAEVDVNDQAAKWAEYLMLRSGKMQLISKPLDRRNLQWALQWGGAMPRPWVEAGCNVKALAAPTAEIPESRRETHRPVRQVRRREQRKERY